uniref:Mucin-5AC n=1 Tax=Rhabditophanes sp. KR3021 TaxID=114890 RepID=A0AC35U3U0_9BILA
MLMQSHLLKGLIFSILFISSYAQYEVESPSAPANQGTEVKISGNQPLQNKEFIYSPTLAPTNNKYMPPPELYVPKGAAPGTEPAAHDNSNGEFIHAATEQQGIDASRSSSSAKSGPPANIKFTLRNLGQDDDTLANFYGDYIAGFNPRHVASASSSTTTSSSLSTSSSTHQSKTGLAQSSSPSWSTLEHASTSNVHPNVNTGSVANGLSAESGDSTNTQPKPSSSQSSQSNSGNGSSSESNRPGSTSSSSLNNISPSGLPPTGSLSGNKITSSEEHKQSSSSSQGETTANKSSSESSATFHAEIDSKSEKQSTDSHTISNIGDLLRTAHPGAKPEDIDIISKAGLLGLDDIEERLKAIKCNEGEEHLESQSHLEPIPQQKIAPEIIDTTKQSSISENNPDTHSIIEETETPATLIDESDGNGHKTAPKESNHQNETDNTKERENSKGTISSPSPPAEKVTQPHLVEVSPSPATLATVDTQQYVKPSATSNVQKIALPNQVEIKNELEKVPLISSSSNALPQSVATSSSGEKALPETFVPPSTVVEKVAPESVSSRTASPQVIPSSTIKASPEDVPSAPKSALPQVIAPSSHADEKIVPEEVSSVTASPPSPSTDIKGKPEIVPSQTALPESTAPSSSIGKISLPESVPYITPTAMSESFVPSVNEKTLSKNVPSLTPKSVVGLLPKGGSSETVSVLEITLTDKSASPSSVGEKTKPESSSVSESIAPESTVPSAAGEKTLPQESSVTSSYVGEKTMPESTITSVSENVSPKSSVPSSSGNAIAESIPSVTKTALPETTATEGKTENVPSTNDEKASPEKIPSIAKTASLQTPASSSSIDEIGLPSISKPALPNTISETIPSASAHSIDTANKLSANTASPSHTILPSTSSKPTINHNTDSILVASITPKHPSSSSSESKETSHKNKSSSSSSEESKPKKEGHGHLTSVTSVPDSLRIPIAPQLPSSIKEVMPEIHPSQITPQIKPSLSEIASTEVRPSQVTPEYIPYVSEITPQITPEVKLPISEITPELPSSVSIPRVEPPVSEVAPEVQPPLSEIAPETHHNLIEISPPTHPSSTEPHSSKIEAFPESPNPSPIESEKVTTSTAAPSSIAYNTPQILVAQTTTQASLSIAQVSTTQATIVIESSNNNIVIVSTQVPASAINHETLAPITAPVAIPTIPTAPHIFVPTKPTKNEGEIKVVEITKLTGTDLNNNLKISESTPIINVVPSAATNEASSYVLPSNEDNKPLSYVSSSNANAQNHKSSPKAQNNIIDHAKLIPSSESIDNTIDKNSVAAKKSTGNVFELSTSDVHSTAEYDYTEETNSPRSKIVVTTHASSIQSTTPSLLLSAFLPSASFSANNNAKNIEGISNVENIEDISNVENINNTENTSNVKSVANVEDIKDFYNVQNIGHINNVNAIKGISNVENIKEPINANNIKAIINVENIKEFSDVVNVKDITNAKDITENINVISTKGHVGTSASDFKINPIAATNDFDAPPTKIESDDTSSLISNKPELIDLTPKTNALYASISAIPPSSQLTPTENKPSTGNKHVGDIIHPSPSEEIHVVAHNSPYISPKNAIGIASKNAIDTSSNIAPSTAITVDHNNIDHSNVDHNNVGTNNIISPSTSRSSVEAPDVLRPSEISAFDKDTAVTASISDKYDTHSEIASPSSVHIVPESHLGNKITSDNAQSNTEASTHKTPSPRVFAPHSAPVNVPVPPPHPSIHKTEPYAQHFSSEVVPTTHEETGERTEQTSEHHVPIITSKSESHEEKQVYTPAVVPQVTKEVNSQERPTSIIETSQIQMKPTEESYTENLTPPVEKSLPIKPIQIESPEPDQTHSVAIPAKPVSLPEESGNEVVPNQDLTHSSETHLNTKTGSSNEEHPTETGSHLEEEFSNQSNYGSANAQKKGGDVVVQKVVEATKETVYKPTNNGNTHNTYHEKTITHSVEPSQIISEVPHQEKSDENRGEEPEAPQSRSEGRTGYEKVIANTETHVSQQVVPQQNTFNPRTTSQIDSTQVQIVPAPEVVETTNTQVQPEQPDQSQQQVTGGSNAGYSQQQGSNYGVAPQNIVYPQQQAQSYQQPQAPSNYGNNYNSGYQSRPQSQPGCCGGNWLSRQGGICAPISNSPCGGIPASPRAPCSIGSNCYSAAPQPAFPPYSSPCQRPCGGCSQPAPRSCCCTPAAPNPLAGFPNLFGSLCTGRKKRSLTWSGICGRYVAAK